MARSKCWLAALALPVLSLVATDVNAQTPRFESRVTVSESVPRPRTPGDHLLSFTTPVALPGVSLATGTYMFKLVGTNRAVVQVMSADGRMTYGQFLPVHIARTSDIDKPAVWLINPAFDGSPRRIQAWFESGSAIGREFVYVQGLLGATQ